MEAWDAQTLLAQGFTMDFPLRVWRWYTCMCELVQVKLDLCLDISEVYLHSSMVKFELFFHVYLHMPGTGGISVWWTVVDVWIIEGTCKIYPVLWVWLYWGMLCVTFSQFLFNYYCKKPFLDRICRMCKNAIWCCIFDCDNQHDILLNFVPLENYWVSPVLKSILESAVPFLTSGCILQNSLKTCSDCSNQLTTLTLHSAGIGRHGNRSSFLMTNNFISWGETTVLAWEGRLQHM